jgi:hypothetical protein
MQEIIITINATNDYISNDGTQEQQLSIVINDFTQEQQVNNCVTQECSGVTDGEKQARAQDH